MIWPSVNHDRAERLPPTGGLPSVQVILVDGVEVAVIPVLLGSGIPLFPPPASQIKLKLIRQPSPPRAIGSPTKPDGNRSLDGEQ
jgi:hypothetical protein